jgi:hypothetical protein
VEECRDWGCARNKRQGIIWQKNGHPTEARKCAHSESANTMRRRRRRAYGGWGCAKNRRRHIIWQKRNGVPAKLGSVLTTNPRRHEAQKVENLSRLWSARNGRHDIMTHKSGRHSEAWGVLGCHQPATAVFEEKVGDPTCDGGP